MIRFKDIIFEDYFIDPITAVITNSSGEIQKIRLKEGRPFFKKAHVHQWQVHTHYGYKEGYDVHHLDENILNNALSNLAYLPHADHRRLHKASEETKKKISDALKGRKQQRNPQSNGSMLGKKHSEETKQKIANSHRGKKLSEEHKKKLSEANKGRKLSKESREKVSNSLKNHYNNHPKKYGKDSPSYGYHWYNDGKKNYFKKECPEGCILGRLNK